VQLPVLAGLCGSGTLVCIDVLFQRLIVQNSSALTLSVVSSIKELLTVFAGIAVFGDEVTTIQFVGMFVAAFGVKLYGSQRRREHAQAKKEYVPRLSACWHNHHASLVVARLALLSSAHPGMAKAAVSDHIVLGHVVLQI